MTLSEKFGHAIVKARKEKGVSQEDLYLKIGRENISRRYLSDVENGKRQVSIGVLEKVANGLDMKLSELAKIAETIEE